MAEQSRRQLRRVTIVFWVLLVYIIAALLWWLISLEQQNKIIHQLRKEAIVNQNSSDGYQLEWNRIDHLQRRNSIKHITEGITFLLLIFFGAVYIYRLVRRQFRVQQQQQNFVMAVTHELKTPISVARLNLETLQRHQLTAEKQQKLMQGSLEEMVRLDGLINNILISSQLEGNAYPATKEELNFSELVKDVCSHFASRYPQRRLETNIEESVELKGDALLLKLLLSNLLENANKYSDKTTPIDCKMFQEAGSVKLQVSDQGIGIPEKEKKKIFDRFYRVGNEQTRRTKGTGLGLFICKKIADHHQATITVSDNASGGSTFMVQFAAT